MELEGSVAVLESGEYFLVGCSVCEVRVYCSDSGTTYSRFTDIHSSRGMRLAALLREDVASRESKQRLSFKRRVDRRGLYYSTVCNKVDRGMTTLAVDLFALSVCDGQIFHTDRRDGDMTPMRKLLHA
jgi:hypothetical protein